jgi:putative peptidoglycan lipid II flippase
MTKMLRAARTVVVFGIVLQGAGVAKLLVIASYFGTGPLLDAYYLGLVIPTFAAAVLTGILQTSFVPVYVHAKSRAEEEAAHKLANFALTWSALALAGVALLATLARGAALMLLTSDTSMQTRAELQAAFLPLLWMAPLTSMADCGALLLNAEGRFAAAASAPLLNIVVGTLVLVGTRDLGIYALVWSLLAGLAAQLVVVLLALRGAKIPLRPQLVFPLPIQQALTAVALPVLIISVLGNLIPAFIQLIAARAGVGAVSAMGYASRLHNAVVQAIVISVSVVLLPHFSRLTAEGRTAELRHSLERVFAATLLFFAAAVVLVAASGPRVLSILLQRGNFSAVDAQQVAAVWLALTVGLLGATWGIFLARLFQAQRKPWVIAKLGVVSVVVNAVLAFTFMPLWGVVGVAAASSLAYTIIMVLFHLRADRALGRVLSSAALGFAARAVVGNAVAYGLAIWLGGALATFGAVSVVLAQVLVVAMINLLLARGAPLGLAFHSVFEV